MRKFTATISAFALVVGMSSSPAFGAVTLLDLVPDADPSSLNAGNLALAQQQCDAAATALDADGPSPDSDIYSGEVVEDAVLLSGPTEVGTEADRNIDESTREGAGTFTPAHMEILGDPYRNGGSVNMFGIQQAVGGRYSNSSYDFTADFNTTYTHSYTCDILVEDYHPAVPHPRVGHWIVHPDFSGNEEAATNNCNAFNGSHPSGPSNGHPTDQVNCLFIVDSEAHEDPAYHDDAAYLTNVAGGSFNQTQTDTLQAHESFGSGFDTSETLLIGQVVVCISPSNTGKKLPGAWRQQNGYTGDKCTTVWYNGGATVGVPNLNTGSHNWVTIPVV